MVIDIRPLLPDDAPALPPLVQGLAAHHGDAPSATEDTLARDIADGWIWGFGAGDPLLGYALLLPHAQVQFGVRGADLHHIYVHPEARGAGVARALVETAEVDAQRRGCHYIVIGAHRGNDAARAVYRALGYDWNEATFWRFRKRL